MRDLRCVHVCVCMCVTVCGISMNSQEAKLPCFCEKIMLKFCAGEP